MVDHPPSTIDASEPVRCGKRKGVATDQFDANYPPLIAANHRDCVVRFDPVLVRIAENVAVRFQDCRTTDQNRPPRMHAGDFVVRPDVAHLPKICACKRFVVRGISGENVVLLAHTLLACRNCRPKSIGKSASATPTCWLTRQVTFWRAAPTTPADRRVRGVEIGN